jgi:hypothetical protein
MVTSQRDVQRQGGAWNEAPPGVERAALQQLVRHARDARPPMLPASMMTKAPAFTKALPDDLAGNAPGGAYDVLGASNLDVIAAGDFLDLTCWT